MQSTKLIQVFTSAYISSYNYIYFLQWWSYELSNRHTYVSATVTALISALLLLGLVLLYKKLAPRNSSQRTERSNESTKHVSIDLGGSVKKDDPGGPQFFTNVKLYSYRI